MWVKGPRISRFPPLTLPSPTLRQAQGGPEHGRGATGGEGLEKASRARRPQRARGGSPWKPPWPGPPPSPATPSHGLPPDYFARPSVGQAEDPRAGVTRNKIGVRPHFCKSRRYNGLRMAFFEIRVGGYFSGRGRCLTEGISREGGKVGSDPVLHAIRNRPRIAPRRSAAEDPPNLKNCFCNLFVCRHLGKWGLTPFFTGLTRMTGPAKIRSRTPSRGCAGLSGFH